MGEQLESDWTEKITKDICTVYDVPVNLINFPTDEEVNELYWMTLGEQAVTNPRRFGTIQVPPHIPLNLTDLYYYINYETHKQTVPPSPEEKWVAVTVAFVRHSPDCKLCFGDMVVERGKRVGKCGACRVGDWCGELKTHLVEHPESERFFRGILSIYSKGLRTDSK